MDVTGIVAMVGLAALVILAGRVGAVCGRARARAAAGRRRTSARPLAGPVSVGRRRFTR